MRNKYAGKCQLCDKYLKPKEGRWRLMAGLRATQDFQGLRCVPCGTTTKKGKKLTKEKLLKQTATLSSQLN